MALSDPVDVYHPRQVCGSLRMEVSGGQSVALSDPVDVCVPWRVRGFLRMEMSTCSFLCSSS